MTYFVLRYTVVADDVERRRGYRAGAFARANPYVENGLVTSWSVREWTDEP